MPTPSWTYNRLTRNINDIETVMSHMDKETVDYRKLHSVVQSLTNLAVLIKKEKKK